MLFGTPDTRSKELEHPVSSIWLDIDNEAGTPIYKFSGSPKDIDFLAYDVTTLADQLRRGGSTAIIGVGGGRDLMAASLFNFRRIVGIELNAGIYDLTTRQLRSFANLDKIPGLEIHQDEGRSYLSRTPEKFDVIQASMVDTWAATSAGAMTLSENSLYTVDAWRIFYRHLNPGGLITFTRWNSELEKIQTSRMFALACATLISEGVSNPGQQIALVAWGPVATILVSNQPLSGVDLQELRTISNRYGFKIFFSPEQPATESDLKQVVATKTLGQLSHLNSGMLDFSPVYALELKWSRTRSGHRGCRIYQRLFSFGSSVDSPLCIPATIISYRRESCPSGPDRFCSRLLFSRRPSMDERAEARRLPSVDVGVERCRLGGRWILCDHCFDGNEYHHFGGDRCGPLSMRRDCVTLDDTRSSINSVAFAGLRLVRAVDPPTRGARQTDSAMRF
jgi:hypothetical protein